MQEFINKNYFILMIFTLIFGVMFYDIINNIGFSYVDEICVVLILILYIIKVYKSPDWKFNKTFLFVLAVFVFYLIYSILIGSNVIKGILLDFFIQIKPYLAFFCVYALMPKLSPNQKKITRQIVLILSVYMFLIGFLDLGVGGEKLIRALFGHPSRFATATSILALLYLYCSDYTKIDRIVFIILLALGLLSGRSKLFGFFALCTLMLLYMNDSFRMKLNVRNTFFIILAVGLTAFVARDKIQLYFITGGFGDGRSTEDLYARMALYYFSSSIFMDNIPFGSGFASYATYASGEYYSPIYEELYMDNLHGLSKSNPEFIADTYYPALAQFGFVGAALFFLFWASLAYKGVKAYEKDGRKEVTIALMIIFLFLIECTSDSTITHNRGIFLMMLLGMIFSDIKEKTKNEKLIQQKVINENGKDITR